MRRGNYPAIVESPVKDTGGDFSATGAGWPFPSSTVSGIDFPQKYALASAVGTQTKNGGPKLPRHQYFCLAHPLGVRGSCNRMRLHRSPHRVRHTPGLVSSVSLNSAVGIYSAIASGMIAL